MPVAEKAPQTLYDKVLQAHIVDEKLDGTILLYIGSYPPLRNHRTAHPACLRRHPSLRIILTPSPDRHLVHEVTSPVCFLGNLWRPDYH